MGYCIIISITIIRSTLFFLLFFEIRKALIIDKTNEAGRHGREGRSKQLGPTFCFWIFPGRAFIRGLSFPFFFSVSFSIEGSLFDGLDGLAG